MLWGGSWSRSGCERGCIGNAPKRRSHVACGFADSAYRLVRESKRSVGTPTCSSWDLWFPRAIDAVNSVRLSLADSSRGNTYGIPWQMNLSMASKRGCLLRSGRS